MTKQDKAMKRLRRIRLFMMMCLMIVGIFALCGCDSGEKAVDKVTGNEAVKQYHNLKKELGKIEEEQAKKYDKVMDDLKEGELKR